MSFRLPQLARLRRLLSHPRLRHPVLPALGAALLCQAALIGLQRPSQGSASPGQHSARQAPAADDTPELLRLSRSLLQSAATPNPELSQLLTLPLPPPPQLSSGPPPVSPQASGAVASCPAQTTPGRPPGPAQAARASTAQAAAPVAAAPAGSGELPSQPGQALELAKAIAAGKQALPSEGASPAQVALQRRQWWLTAQEAGQLQRAWDQADAEQAPEDWTPLPAGAQLRRVERQSLGALASGDPRGRSLLNREQITLLWGSGPQLWLLRLPLAGQAQDRA